MGARFKCTPRSNGRASVRKWRRARTVHSSSMTSGGSRTPGVPQRSLGQFAHTFTKEAAFGKSRMARPVTRQTYYNDDEEADFDPEAHVPTRAQLL